MSGVVAVSWVLVLAIPPLSQFVDRLDRVALQALAELRTDAVNTVMRRLQLLGSDAAVRTVGWVALAGALAFRRVRHVVVFVLSLLVLTQLESLIAVTFARARPTGVEILGQWAGFSHPSRPVAALAAACLGVTYLLLPSGRWRDTGKWVTGAAVTVLAVAQMYLGVDHPTDVLIGAVLGVAIPLIAFRTFVPSAVFPLTYRRGRSAHLDVSGTRGHAIRTALSEQLGLDAAEVTPYAWEGSAGSTPVRITLAGDPPVFLFGKVYAAGHLRADRSYKLMRTLLYGRLEDEASFSTVRRLVQYEDYVLRLMDDAGLPAPRPYGFVELTPEREYLLVTEFFAGSREIGDPQITVTEEMVDQALLLVRGLWQAGLAHRDIKPANVLVGPDGRIRLIDLAFAEVRPSPWRQAVDLANMMIVLGLRCDTRVVYERALAFFSADEIAEAFAATRGVTMPSQSRSLVRRNDRDLVRRFRELAPRRPPIKIQRWSVRRVALTVAVLIGAVLAVNAVRDTLLSVNLL
jgi:membrane-associated phospholipid phosphatase